jgi:hypothetical protein
MFSRRMLSAAVASSAFLLLLPVAPSACLPLRRMLTVELLLVGRLLFRLLQALLFLLLLALPARELAVLVDRDLGAFGVRGTSAEDGVAPARGVGVRTSPGTGMQR